MTEERSKICYILPKYDANTDTHFSYLYDLLNKVSNSLDIFLVIEKCVGELDFKGVAKIVIKKEKGNFLSKFFEGVKIAKEAQKAGYKDFYIHYSFIGALSALFVSRGGRGRVFYWNCGMPWLYKRNIVQETIFKFILRNVLLVTGTASLKIAYAKEYGLDESRIRVLHNWINLEEFNKESVSKNEAKEKLNINTEKPVILFIHHLSKRKGADMIIPTARIFKDGYFVVVGDGPYTEELKNEINADEDLKGRVRMEGRRPQNQMPLYLSASDILFMPSEEEGFPHVLLEAMALGIPYVASDVGSVRDISPEGEQKYIYTERTPENFANGIRDMLANPVGGAELKTHVTKYDINPISKMFIGLFE